MTPRHRFGPMIRPGERSRLVPLVLAVCLAVLVFACSTGSDQPADEAAIGTPPPAGSLEVEAMVPAAQAAGPAPVAQAPAAPAAAAADAAPATAPIAPGITF